MKRFEKSKGFLAGMLVMLFICITIVPAAAAGIELVVNKMNLRINHTVEAEIGGNYERGDGGSVPSTILYEGTTYIPIRMFGEIYGQDVYYGENTKTAYLFDIIDQANFQCDIMILEGAENFRDIGGYIGTDGKAVNKGVFLRSAGLTKLTDADIKAITDKYDISLDLDFRSEEEIAENPDPQFGDADYTHAEIVFGAGKDDPVKDIYIKTIDLSKDSFKNVMEILADPDYETTIFHCTAGKDRTGMTAMLLLDLAGVSKEDIVKDYGYTKPLTPKAHMNVYENFGENPAEVFFTIPEAMAATYDHLHKEYGGAEGYLKECGVSDATISALKTKLLG